MGKIGNKDLSRVLSEKHGLDKADADKFVELMFDVLNTGLKEEKLVKVKGLGTFKVTSVASRKSVDVNTGEPIVIEGRDKISFTPDNSLRDQVNRPFAQFDTVVLNDGVDFGEIDNKFADTLIEPEEGTGDDDEDTPLPAQSAETSMRLRHEAVSIEEAAPAPQPIEESAVVSEPIPGEKPVEPVNSPEPLPLQLSANQLDVLNGGNPKKWQTDGEAVQSIPTDENLSETESEEPQVAEPAAEGDTGADASEPVEAPDVVTPVEDHRVDAAVQYSQELESAGEEDSQSDGNAAAYNALLEERIERQQTTLKWLVGVACVLLVLAIGSVVYMFNQLAQRDNRIRHLEAQAALLARPVKSKAAALVDTDAVKKAQADRAQALKAADAIKAADQAERKVISSTTPAAQESALTKEVEAVKKQAKTSVSTTSTDDKQQKEYDKDVRIRTGAYRIVGIDRTVTVRAGQTLESISKASLGAGMECYIEAVNGGKREFKAGEKVNIPALKLKKSR
jgi:nucleoid DNA-binding protein